MIEFKEMDTYGRAQYCNVFTNTFFWHRAILDDDRGSFGSWVFPRDFGSPRRPSHKRDNCSPDMDKVPPEKPETDAAVAFEMAAAAERDREEGTTMRSSDEDTLRREDLVRDAVLNELSEEPLVDSLTGEAPEPSEIHHLPVRVKRWPRWRNRLRLYMLFPHRSKLGRALQWAFRSFVICSVITLIAETLPFARTDPSEVTNRTFYALDMLWSASFTLEFLLRCISMASWRYEFASWWTLVDFLSSIPFYVQLIVANVTRSYDGTDNLALRDGIRLLRLFRVVRLFKLGHHNTTMQLLLASLSSSKQGISTLFIGFPLLSVFWGSVFYYFESLSCYQGKDGLWYYHGNDKLSSFQSILDGIWFAM